MNNKIFDNDIPKYRKKSTATPPKKATHKHVVVPCILSYPEKWWEKDHLRGLERKVVIGGYCPLCGKIGTLRDKSLWYAKEIVVIGEIQTADTVLTEEGKKEMDAETRTLPYFEIDNPFTKFVDITTVETGEEDEE